MSGGAARILPDAAPVISAAGVVSAAGSGFAAFAEALSAGESLAKPGTLLATEGFPVPRVCEVPGLVPKALARRPADAKVLSRASVLALAALADLRAVAPGALFSDPWRGGIFLGVGLEQGDHRDLLPMLAASRDGARLPLAGITARGIDAMNPLSSLKTLPNMALAHVGIKLGEDAPRGANAAYSPFDAASVEAIGAAADSVARGESEAALAGGADAPVSLFGLTTFARLGVSTPARPLGEAAALFLVEPPARARTAGRRPMAEVLGRGSTSDGARVGASTAATTLSGAISAAVRDARIEADAVDLLCASFGDPAADPALLGLPRARRVLAREVFGETVAAGGALACAAALAAFARDSAIRIAVVCAGSFGGDAAALVLRRPA